MSEHTTHLTPESEAEISERAPKRLAELTTWLNRNCPIPGQEVIERAETVLEEDVPALLAEIDRLRAERDEVLLKAADAIDEEAWPHERDERENQLIYRMADKVRRMADEAEVRQTRAGLDGPGPRESESNSPAVDAGGGGAR